MLLCLLSMLILQNPVIQLEILGLYTRKDELRLWCFQIRQKKSMIHSLDIGGQIFYHIHTSCDKHCVAMLHYKYKLRVKSKDSERSHGNPTNTMYVTFHTVNFNTANKLFTLNLTYNATPCHIVYDCGKKVGNLRSNNYHIVLAWSHF